MRQKSTANRQVARVLFFRCSHALKRRAASGLVVAFLLWGLSSVREGGRQAFRELGIHVLSIHPMFLALTAFLALTTFAFEGWILKGKLARTVLLPFMEFIAHSFGVAIGAVPVFYLASSVVGDSAVPLLVVVIVEACALVCAVVAEASIAGTELVEAVSELQATIALAMLVTAGALVWVCLGMQGSSEEIWRRLVSRY